ARRAPPAGRHAPAGRGRARLRARRRPQAALTGVVVPPPSPPGAAAQPAGGAVIVCCLGASLTPAPPPRGPAPVVRAGIEAPDERSQWQWWAERADASLELRNHGVNGERTDQIAARVDAALSGVDGVIVQGGINDVVQRRPVEDAARNLAAMV